MAEKLKLRKGDRVVVLSGKDIGKEGEITRVIPERRMVIVDGVNVAKQAPARDQGHDAGRDHRQGHADPHLEPRDPVPVVRPTRVGYRFDATATRSGLQEVREGRLMAGDAASADVTQPDEKPRLKAQYDDEIRCGAAAASWAHERHGGAAPREDRAELRRRAGDAAGVAARRCGRRPDDHHRPEAAHHEGEEVDRRLQAPRGQRDRGEGHAARRPHVGVLRPAREPGDPPHPRLPRDEHRRRSTAAATTRSASPSS